MYDKLFKQLEKIAQQDLLIDTLKEQLNGNDFQEVAVWNVLEALKKLIT